jgi:glycosyltransferase involved in cell wall biosynthesis
MSTSLIKLSFCVSVYNEEEILEENLKKIINELDKNSLISTFEVLVVDNGSTDKTNEQLEFKL